MSKIERHYGGKIVRVQAKGPFHAKNEVMAAQEQLGGHFPRASTKSWYRDIYDFYQNNEV